MNALEVFYKGYKEDQILTLTLMDPEVNLKKSSKRFTLGPRMGKAECCPPAVKSFAVTRLAFDQKVKGRCTISNK